jgi:hypothetical protein
MSAAAGWYPDPGGQPGKYRYWDGRSWSAAVSSYPGTPPPEPAFGHGQPPSGAPVVPPTPPRKRTYGWLIALAAVIAVLVVVVVLVVRQVGPTETTAGPPAGQPTSQVCPTPDSGTAGPQPNDGRVHAGKLSYPQLGSPWSPPFPEYRVAFGRGVLIQSVEIEHQAGGWEAAVLIGGLVAGDGFFTPQDGAAIVVRCVTGTFYGGSEVTRDDQVDRAMTVDGHDAWIIESQLGFDVPGIQAKHELLIVVIVDTGGDAGLFYASIPENAPELVKPARDALANLRVED